MTKSESFFLETALEKIISKIKKSFLNTTLAIGLVFGASVKSSDYSVSQVINESKIEHRLYYKQHRFMTIIDDSGTFNIRPHPGLDRNGWGSSWYMQPFLPSANLKHTTIGNIVPGKAKNSTKALADTFTVKGEIAVEDVSVNLASEDVVITWGDQAFTILAGNFTAQSGNSYKCSKIPTNGDSGLATAKIDLDKCTFNISVKNAELDDVSNPVEFGLSFADFDETAEINPW